MTKTFDNLPSNGYDTRRIVAIQQLDSCLKAVLDRSDSSIMRTVIKISGLFVLAMLVADVAYHQGYRTAERSARAELDKVTLRELIEDVDKICDRLGRAPLDQSEVESLLGRPIPRVHDEGLMGGRIERPVYYQKTAGDSYQLTYELMATDDWTYESINPEAGWVQSWY